jgi:hypothetical protein
MSVESTGTQSNVNLKELVEQSGLGDSLQEVEQVEEAMYRMRAGSAMLVVGVKERALVIISPMFKTLPVGREPEFCHRLLQLNCTLGGIVNFAIQPDGWVVLHGGRDTSGMDAAEFRIVVQAVAEAADYFDNLLLEEFYSTAPDSAPLAEDDDDSEDVADEDADEGVTDADIEE